MVAKSWTLLIRKIRVRNNWMLEDWVEMIVSAS
jgi:hypothetical protein